MKKTWELAVKPSPGQGGAEQASERTWKVRERARTETNAGMGGMGGQR